MVTPPRMLKIRDTRMFVATEATSVIHDIPYYEKRSWLCIADICFYSGWIILNIFVLLH